MASYVETFYSRTASDADCYPEAHGLVAADVCIIGAGLAGLTAALSLARRGRSVIVLESHRIAWGASGRNGGFVSAGYATSLSAIERMAGRDRAAALYRMSIEGVDTIRANIAALGIEGAAPVTGIIKTVRYDPGDALSKIRDRMERDFGSRQQHLRRDELSMLLRSGKYHEALLDDEAFHFHPLNYARGLTREASRLGVQIFENSAVIAIDLDSAIKRVMTERAEVSAQHVVFATGGYTDGIFRPLRRSYLPIATYVLLTEPAPERIGEAIRTQAAVLDDRRAGDYYRLVAGGTRILWGGRITTRTTDPKSIAALLEYEMTTTYPQLAGVKTELAWSGLMSYARHLMPQTGQWRPGIWYCTAFGGHGMNTSTLGGTLIAEGIVGDSDRYRLFEPFGLTWNGGTFGKAAVQLTYWSYQAMDFVRE